MALNDVKEITVPVSGTDKAVKMIQDSNGNIIWGSQSAFPYRKLEYIHFNGAEWINFGLKLPYNVAYKRLDMRCRYNSLDAWASSGYYSSRANKFLLGLNGSGYTQYAVGSAYVYNSNDLIQIDTNNFYDWVLWSNSGNSDLSIYYGPGEVNLKGKTNNHTYTFTSDTGNMCLGAFNNDGSVTSYCKLDVKYIKIRLNSFNNITLNGVPCQRKSDGKCGIYDLTNNVFYAMQGTNTTSAAAGPVVDEYWNLQA